MDHETFDIYVICMFCSLLPRHASLHRPVYWQAKRTAQNGNILLLYNFLVSQISDVLEIGIISKT